MSLNGSVPFGTIGDIRVVVIINKVMMLKYLTILCV